MNQNNVITWKDADQNLCKLVGRILENASRELRADTEPPSDYFYSPQMTGGKGEIPKDYASEGPRPWHAVGLTDLAEYKNEDGLWDFLDEAFDAIAWGIAGDYSVQCWWSFQNIVRWRFRQARAEIVENLYGAKKRKSKKVRILSRNRNKRKQDKRLPR
jgi:hypothetical protein